MKSHSVQSLSTLLSNFAATIGLLRSKDLVGSAVTHNTQLMIVFAVHLRRIRNRQKYAATLTDFSLRAARKPITSVQLEDFTNVFSVTNGDAKLYVTKSCQLSL